jgi:twitching motility two-component system response regulator PilH
MGRKVLIIDDDLDIRTFISSVVENTGYEPVLAQDGEEGLTKVRSERPGVITLDVLMPKESGIKMYREMKTDAELKDIPVIVVSGIAKRTFLRSQRALAEFDGETVPEPEAYFEKPADPEELGAMIRKLVS